jgi:PAS domain S-box-containing protein
LSDAVIVQTLQMKAKGKILVVDDNYSSGELIKAILEVEGYLVHTEQSGESALFNMNTIQPDLVLLDVWMPGMNGFEVCKMLKEGEQTKEIPIIFLSASTDTIEKVKGFQLGAVDFISKPFEQTELLARVQTHLQINQMRLQLKQQSKELSEFNQQLEIEIIRRKQAEERYDAFINADLDMIFVKDDQFKYLIVNNTMAKFFGKTKEEMIGKTDQELSDENVVFPCQSSDRRALEAESAFVIEEQLGARFCETTKFPLLLSKNKKGVGGIIRDLTEQKKVEEGLRKFILGIENTNDAIFITDINGEFEFINAAFEKIYGYCYSDIIGKTPRILKSGLLSKKDYEYFWNALLSKKSTSGEIQNKTKDGRIITIEENTTPIINDKDEIIGFISVNRDATERKKLLEEVNDEKKLLRTLIDIIPDAIYIKDELGRKMVTNQADLRIMNAADESEILGKTDLEILTGTIAEMGYSDDMKVIKSGIPILAKEDLFTTANGEPLWLLSSKIPIINSEGKVTGLVGVGRDITIEKKQSEALELSESKYRNLFENNPAPMWIYDLETLRFLELNDTAIIQYGYSREEFLCMTLKDIRPEEDIELLLKDVELTTHPFNKAGVWRHVKKNGEIIFVEIISHQIEFEERPARMVIINDVTERKKIENALVESEKSLKQAQIVANMCDWEYDLKTNKLKWSENSYRIYELEPFEIEPTYEYLRSRVHPDDLHLINEGYLSLLQTRLPVEQEIRITFPDNRIKWIQNKIIPTFDDETLVFLNGVNIDITELKKSNEQIVKLSTALEQSHLSILITDKIGMIEYVNPKLVQITGYTSDELMGQNPRIFKSGEKTSEDYKELWDTISSGNEWRGEFHDRKKNGELYWESASISPIRNEKGEIINYIAIKEDITNQKILMNELVLSKEKAEESDRLKSAFLANMSHEIRTPLNGILGFTELLVDPDFDAEQKNEMAKLILDNGELLLSIINDVLDISKIEAGQIVIQKSQFGVGKLISDIKDTFTVKAQQNGLEMKIARNDSAFNLELNTDYVRLRQVLTNLVSNALKYTEIGFVEIGCIEKINELTFYVKDSGIGVSEENKEKIFERFNRQEAYTKKVGGAGLGLSIAKSFVEMLGGKIWVESEQGKGSCFYFTIPI